VRSVVTRPRPRSRASAACTARTATSPRRPGGGEENAGVEAYAIDGDAAARLWTVSAELTNVDAFAMA
jgi:hypothetical protein